jgi:flagellar basal-body rod protein FlgF
VTVAASLPSLLTPIAGYQIQGSTSLTATGSPKTITVPLDAQVSIGPDGSVLVANAEQPNLPPQPVDRLKLADPAGSSIAKGLDGLFRVVGGGVLPTDDTARLVPGSLEASNVNASDVLTQMIQAQRLFDIRTKLISTAKDVDQSSSTLLRLPS